MASYSYSFEGRVVAEKTYYIYMLECSNGALYTGYTTDLERRWKEHQSGSPKCKYTRAFPPKRMVASWELELDLGEVLSLEAKIKKLSTAKKWALSEQASLNGFLGGEIPLTV